jgi:hypothetical protein
MRRALGLLIVVMLLAVGSSTALAATSQKITIRALIAQAGWEDYNEDTGAGEFGDLQFATAEGTTTVYLALSKGELVLCEGGETPDDPFDDYYGFVGTETMGQGPAKLSLGKTYSSAKASGTVTAEVYTYNECTGDEGTATEKTITVSLDLDGISPIITEKLRSTITIPQQLRSKTMIQAQSREAAGSIKVGSRTIDVGGVIGLIQLKASLSER